MHFLKKIFFKLLLVSTTVIGQTTEQPKIKTLIIDGQNNHGQWPKISYMLKKYMVDTKLFSVDLDRTAYTWKGEKYIQEYALNKKHTEALKEPKKDPNYAPNFSDYDLVICNFGWKAASWPEKTQKAFEEFIENGGGLVVFHAADNSFPEWLAYNKMIGLGGWGNRSEKDGPYVYYNEKGKLIRDTSVGSAGAHGPQSEYQIQIRDKKHPITKGLPKTWLHTKDELYNSLRGPAENMTVLATAYSKKENKGSGRHEPALMTLEYGKGRIFHSIMGHADYSVQCVGFITTFLRGAEWAATGKVTQKIPKDFPKKDKTSSRPFHKVD